MFALWPIAFWGGLSPSLALWTDSVSQQQKNMLQEEMQEWRNAIFEVIFTKSMNME